MKTSDMFLLRVLEFLSHAYLSHREGHRSSRARNPVFYSRKQQKKIGVSFRLGTNRTRRGEIKLSYAWVINGLVGMAQKSRHWGSFIVWCFTLYKNHLQQGDQPSWLNIYSNSSRHYKNPPSWVSGLHLKCLWDHSGWYVNRTLQTWSIPTHSVFTQRRDSWWHYKQEDVMLRVKIH